MGACISGGGGVSYTTFSTWGRGDDGDTKFNIFAFDLFTLSINIDLRIQWFHVFSSIFSWKLRIIFY